MSTPETRERLLDAAEFLFARDGLDATSLRAITTRAGTNLAAVNYHFETKDGLIAAVFRRRGEPLNAERLQRLEAARRTLPRGALPVETILRALLEPVMRLRAQTGGAHFLRLLARVFSEPGEIRLQVLAQFRPTAARFLEALGEAVPHVPRRELVWRLHFLIGSLAHAVCAGDVIRQMAGGADGEEAPALLDRLVAYGAAGLRAPWPPDGEPGAAPFDTTDEATPGRSDPAPSPPGEDGSP